MEEKTRFFVLNWHISLVQDTKKIPTNMKKFGNLDVHDVSLEEFWHIVNRGEQKLEVQ